MEAECMANLGLAAAQSGHDWGSCLPSWTCSCKSEMGPSASAHQPLFRLPDCCRKTPCRRSLRNTELSAKYGNRHGNDLEVGAVEDLL